MVKRIAGYPVNRICRARMPQDPSSVYDILLDGSTIAGLEPADPDKAAPDNVEGVYDAQGCIVASSLGDFNEAMAITGKAKARFEEDDLMRRGRRLISESINSGVTAMRAFVEVDEIVGLKCISAAVRLKEEFNILCDVQICVLAQLAIFSGQGGGFERRRLLTEAIRLPGVEAVGSTPYVEDNQHNMDQNVDWTITLALTYGKHLDFHLDHNINIHARPQINMVIDKLRAANWEANASSDRTICFGHCTRLTLFTKREWLALKAKIGTLPIYFIGLPKSDLFMMGRPMSKDEGGGIRQRVKNISCAFTPWGSCDPLSLASLGVGVYQAGTKQDTETLFSCVSSAAKTAIGMVNPGGALSTDLVIYGSGDEPYNPRSIAELVYNPTPHRTIIRNGRVMNVS